MSTKDDIIEYLQGIDTPTLCNAIELLELRSQTENFTSNKIKCLFPELGTMVGYAVTVQMETMTRMAPRDPAMSMKYYEAIETSPKPAIIVMQEMGAHREFASHSGEVMTVLAKNFGAIGLVSDVNVRDFNEVKSHRFHNFASGLSPSHAYARIVDVGMPVQIHGMTVRPGDIIHGDINGLTQVPQEGIEELPLKIREVIESESRLMDRVMASEFTLDDLRSILFKDETTTK